MTYSKELHDRVRENLHMFDYPRFDDGDIHGLLDEIERLQKLVDAKQNRCAELESRLDLYHGNMYDVVCQENDKLQSALTTAQEENKQLKETIRIAVADYMCSEGCSCCRDIGAHEVNTKRLAELLNVPMYDDESGFNFSQFRSESALNGGK